MDKASDFKRRQKLNLPVIPASRMVKKRLREVQRDARKLEVLLRWATELEDAAESEPSQDEGYSDG